MVATVVFAVGTRRVDRTDYKGFIHFDYFSANGSFSWNFDIKAQYGWAYLIRDIRFLLKHSDKKTKAWAECLLDRSRQMFSADVFGLASSR